MVVRRRIPYPPPIPKAGTRDQTTLARSPAHHSGRGVLFAALALSRMPQPFPIRRRLHPLHARRKPTPGEDGLLPSPGAHDARAFVVCRTRRRRWRTRRLAHIRVGLGAVRTARRVGEHAQPERRAPRRRVHHLPSGLGRRRRDTQRAARNGCGAAHGRAGHRGRVVKVFGW